MSNNYESLIDKKNSNKLEPFDKIEQNTKRYIPNIPSVISDMKKNNIYQSEMNKDESSQKKEENNNKIKNEFNEKEKINNNQEEILKVDNNTSNDNDFLKSVSNYWTTFTNNETVSTIINPFQDDGECVNKVYKIYSCITITLILIVILLSITLS